MILSVFAVEQLSHRFFLQLLFLFFRSFSALFPFLPYFKRIDNILPEDIAAWANTGKRIQIGACYPDGKGSVFLSQSLTGIDRGVEKISDEFT